MRSFLSYLKYRAMEPSKPSSYMNLEMSVYHCKLAIYLNMESSFEVQGRFLVRREGEKEENPFLTCGNSSVKLITAGQH